MEGYQRFIGDWAFKHPSPWDFFNILRAGFRPGLDGSGPPGTTRPGLWIMLWNL